MPLAWASSSLSIAINLWGVIWGASSDGERAPRLGRWLRRLASVGVVAFSCARVATECRVSATGTPRELQTVAPVLGTAHPTGFPTYVLLGWVANSLLSAVRRPRVPDEPVRGPAAWRSRPRVTVVSSGALTGSAVLGAWPASGSRSTRHRLGRSRTQAERAPAPPAPAPSCCSPGGRAGRERRHGTRTAGCRGGGRVRAGGRQPLADPAPRAADRPVSCWRSSRGCSRRPGCLLGCRRGRR